jgi:hypothetical protein
LTVLDENLPEVLRRELERLGVTVRRVGSG